MAKTIKELAKELNCSYEAVRKQVKRYGKELQEHIYLQHKTQYLDDYACDFLRDKRMDSPVVVSRIEYDEAVELLKNKYTELLEKHNALQEENRTLIADKNAQIALLEADNEAARVKVAEAEEEAQKAQQALTDAHAAFEKDLGKKNDKIQELEAYAAAQKARADFFATPWIKRIGKKAPELPELQED